MTTAVAAKKLSASQRNTMIDMLQVDSEARRKAISEYRALHDQVHASIVAARAKEPKAAELVKKIISLQKQLNEAETALEALGLRVDEENVKLAWRSDKTRNEVDRQVEQEIGAESDIHRRFDKAIAQVLKAETAEEAAAVVESLL